MPTGSSRWVGTALAAVLIAFLTACAPEAPQEPDPPKLTIKRNVILEDFSPVIDELYNSAPATSGSSMVV